MSSFESIYHQLALPLTKFIVKRLGGNTEAVDEVFSDTITAAWKGWHTFNHKSSYFTWLCRIALNKIADYYRDQINRESMILTPALKGLAEADPRDLSPEEKLALEDLCASVRNCINLLPPHSRKLLYMRYWQHLSIKDIAVILGISERATEGKLYRAKHSLRRKLAKVKIMES